MGAREVKGHRLGPAELPVLPRNCPDGHELRGICLSQAPPPSALRPAPGVSPRPRDRREARPASAPFRCRSWQAGRCRPALSPRGPRRASPSPPRGVAAWDRRVAKAVPCQSSPLCAGEHSPRAANPVLLSFGSAWRGGPRHGPRGGCWTGLSLPTEKSLEGLTASRAVAPSLGGQASRSRGSGFEADPVF